jgi:glycosyltransferase involved in cell wall biosynthesis
VYFSKSSDIGPSSRYRIYQYGPHLAASGVECTIYPLWMPGYFAILSIHYAPIRNVLRAGYAAGRFAKRFLDICCIGKADLVVVEGQLFPYLPSWAEQLLVWMGYKLVIEFDDAIYLTPFHEKKLSRLLRIATAAIVGNRTLEQWACRHVSNVKVVPTVVDTEKFIPPTFHEGKRDGNTIHPPVIVWIGLAYNFSYLDVLIPALRTVQRQFNAKVRVISSRPPVLAGVDVEFVPWALDTEVERLQECTIGVMPLPDTEWASGKCGLKLLQYMSVGMPAVASPVGVNREIIASGVNGLLAMTSEEWASHLVELCADVSLRERLGKAGRRTVEEMYALKTWGPRLAEEYLALAGQAGLHQVGAQAEYVKRQCA